MLCGMASNSPTAARPHAGSPKARSFGNAIREIREGLPSKPSLRSVATALGIDPSRLSKIETGKAVPKPDIAERILEHLGVSEGQAAELLKLLEGAETEQPWHANTLPEQRQHISMVIKAEDDAAEIVEYTIGLIPGLLQTKGYARAVMTGGSNPLPASEANIRVMTRLGRQGVLSPERDQPVQLLALIHQTALRQDVGGPAVMIEQLEYLQKVGRRPNVEIRIVPDGVGWHEGLEGSFIIITPRADVDLYPLVFVEYRRSGLILHADEDVAAYRDAVDSVQRLAMTSTSTEEVIARTIKEMRTQSERT